MISAKNLSFAYDGISALDGLSFDIQSGDFVAIVGPNGSGKSTLVKLIIGLLPMQTGSLKVFGRKPDDSANRNLIGYIPQKYSVERLFPGTVRELLHAQGTIVVFKELGLDEFIDKKFVKLSGGQQQRVLIALALSKKPKLLVLDEPTVGVDIKTQREFFAILRNLNSEKKITIILVTHDVGMIPSIAKSVLCVNHSICCMGKASETPRLVRQIYGSHMEHHHHEHHHTND